GGGLFGGGLLGGGDGEGRGDDVGGDEEELGLCRGCSVTTGLPPSCRTWPSRAAISVSSCDWRPALASTSCTSKVMCWLARSSCREFSCRSSRDRCTSV